MGLETERSLSAISKDVNENDIRSRSSSWKSNENIEYVRKPDKLLSKFEEHQQWRRKVEQDDDDQIEVNNDIRRFDGRKEYPLRSLMEKNNYEHDGLTSDISRFKWVCECCYYYYYYSCIPHYCKYVRNSFISVAYRMC